jgi:hypothetical protein
MRHQACALPGVCLLENVSLAQYHGVLEAAARRLHDEHLSVGSYHLFRLPEEVEQDLHAMVQSRVGDELASKTPQSKEAAMDALKRLAADGQHVQRVGSNGSRKRSRISAPPRP